MCRDDRVGLGLSDAALVLVVVEASRGVQCCWRMAWKGAKSRTGPIAANKKKKWLCLPHINELRALHAFALTGLPAQHLDIGAGPLGGELHHPLVLLLRQLRAHALQVAAQHAQPGRGAGQAHVHLGLEAAQHGFVQVIEAVRGGQHHHLAHRGTCAVCVIWGARKEAVISKVMCVSIVVCVYLFGLRTLCCWSCLLRVICTSSSDSSLRDCAPPSSEPPLLAPMLSNSACYVNINGI